MTLQVDRDEIIQKINLYGLAVDARRWDLFDRIFTVEPHLDYGEASRWSDLEAFKRDFADMHSVYCHTQHAVYGHVVDVEEHRANAFSYVAWRLIVRANEVYAGNEGSACYDDSLIRLASGWFIARRIVRVTWRNEVTVPAATFERLNSELPMNQLNVARLALFETSS